MKEFVRSTSRFVIGAILGLILFFAVGNALGLNILTFVALFGALGVIIGMKTIDKIIAVILFGVGLWQINQMVAIGGVILLIALLILMNLFKGNGSPSKSHPPQQQSHPAEHQQQAQQPPRKEEEGLTIKTTIGNVGGNGGLSEETLMKLATGYPGIDPNAQEAARYALYHKTMKHAKSLGWRPPGQPAPKEHPEPQLQHGKKKERKGFLDWLFDDESIRHM